MAVCSDRLVILALCSFVGEILLDGFGNRDPRCSPHRSRTGRTGHLHAILSGVKTNISRLEHCYRLIQGGCSIELTLAIQGISDSELESVGPGLGASVLGDVTRYPRESVGSESLVKSCFGPCHPFILSR